MISIIVAVSENNVIGKNNQLLWHLPNDFRYFKEKTIGKPIIMGRKTFESIGRPLPQRLNIVISRDDHFHHEGVLRANSLAEAIDLAEIELAKNAAQMIAEQASKKTSEKNPEIMILGGGSIYEQALSITDKVYLTRVHENIGGDVFFPALDLTIWHLNHEEKHFKDEKHAYDYTFQEYSKK